MSNLEILCAITGAIALTEALSRLYNAIETRGNLPEAFLGGGKCLSPAKETLELAHALTYCLEETRALKQNLDDCRSKLPLSSKYTKGTPKKPYSSSSTRR